MKPTWGHSTPTSSFLAMLSIKVQKKILRIQRDFLRGGTKVCRLLEDNGESWPWFSFSWWKEIASLEESQHPKTRFQYSSLPWRLQTPSFFFKNYPWVGIVPLQVTFLRFFSLSTQKEVKVRELRELIDGVRDWSLGWVRNLFVWGFDILDRLLGVLDGKAPMEGEHMWWWNVEDNGGFLVKSSYNLVYDLLFRMWL
ncbi:hypothetical protein MTR_3g052470 [Medicago truncatula]|uniref:Uncharacterized protein n=1 Tax=Medicago truncatula TaxID=3880 RepID=G7IY36_MEDTR|nr:hypothetical protein MTR_3g052470 [Medicago truncatula]